MKKIVFSLLLLFWCNITSAQNKSEVLDAVRKTVEEYFMPDFNDAIEFPEWRNPDNAEGLASCSRVYIEPNHFFRNGKVCSSYAAWVNQYCSQKLHGKVIEHILTLDENLQKVKGDNDLYRIEASLERKWVIENGLDIPTEKIILTFQWRGAGKLVYIMHMDGDISPIQLSKLVEVNTTDRTKATDEKNTAQASTGGEKLDYVSDSSTIGYFFSELFEKAKKEKMVVFCCFMFFSLATFAILYFDKDFDSTSKSDWVSGIFASLFYGVSFVFIIFGLISGCGIGIGMYRGTYIGTKIRSEMLKAYENHRLVAPGQTIAVSKDGKWGLIDFKGHVTYPLVLDSITDVSGNWAIGHADKKLALIPLHLNTQKVHWKSNISPFVNGKAIIEERVGGKEPTYYLFDTNVPENSAWKKLPYVYISFQQPELNRYLFQVGKGEYGLMDGEGNVIVEAIYKRIKPFSNGLARVNTRENKVGYIDLSGKEVVQAIYDYTFDFSEGLAGVKNDKGLWGYVDKQGNLVIPHKFKGAGSFHEGLAIVSNESYLHGYIDKNGKIVIPFKYTYANKFSEGLAAIGNEKGHHGYINKAGELVIPYKFITAFDFKDGQAKVWYSNKKWGIIDKKGNLISLNQ